MSTTQIKEVIKPSISTKGKVQATIVHKDGSYKRVTLGRIRYGLDGNEIHKNLPLEVQELVFHQSEVLARNYLKANHMKTAAQIEYEAEQYISQIRNGQIQPSFVAVFRGY